MNKSRISQLIKKAFVLSFFIIALQGISIAQNQDVIIIDTYHPTISDAFKINENPKVIDTVVKKMDLNYQVTPVLYKTTFNIDPIKPAKMVGEPLTKLYKSYVKVGFGTKVTPFAELYFNNLRSTDQSIGFYFKHLSSSGKIKDFAFPGFSDNDAGIYARRFYKNHTLSGEVDYKRDVIHYFGFDPETYAGISKDSIKQRFSKIGASLKFKSTFQDSIRLNHSFALSYYNLRDLYKAMEDNISFSGAVDKKVSLFGNNLEYQNLGLIANVDYFNDINPVDTSFGAVVKLTPHYSATYNILKFDAGFNTFFEATNDSKIYIFPDVSFNINLYNNIFVLYAGITSDLKRNNLMDLAEENPFINTTSILKFSRTKSKFYGGFKGSLSSYLSFNASVSKSNIVDMPLYFNDTSSILLNRFSLIYDNIKVFNTHTEITYQRSEKYKFLLISNFYQFATTNELYAWLKPNMDVKLAFNYNLKNKILLKTEVFAFSSSDAKTLVPGTVPEIKPIRMKGTVDFNLGLEYRYSKILSAFINFNNISAVRYQRWYNYPTYGFTVLGGISYAF
jgi:hypothetical protein